MSYPRGPALTLGRDVTEGGLGWSPRGWVCIVWVGSHQPSNYEYLTPEGPSLPLIPWAGHVEPKLPQNKQDKPRM